MTFLPFPVLPFSHGISVYFKYTSLTRRSILNVPLQEFIQNATLAGGVAVGTTGNMPLQPWGALLMGTLAAIISVSGYRFLSVRIVFIF